MSFTYAQFLENEDYQKVIILDISRNGLNTLPINIEKLTNLQELNCSYNKLTEISSTIGKLINLEVFDCSHNYTFQNLLTF